MKPKNKIQRTIEELKGDSKRVFYLACARARESSDRSVDRLDLVWWCCINAQVGESYAIRILHYLMRQKLLGLFSYDDRPWRYVVEQEVLDLVAALAVAQELELTSSNGG